MDKWVKQKLLSRSTPRKPFISNPWFSLSVAAGAVIVGGAWDKLLVRVIATLVCVGALGKATWDSVKWTAWWTERRRLMLMAPVGILVIIAILKLVGVFSESPTVLNLNSSLIVDKSPRCAEFTICLPGDSSVYNAIEQNLITRSGYKIASSQAAVRLDIENNEQTSWTDFNLKMIVHYELQNVVPMNNNWRRLQTLDQSVSLSNCGATGPWCHEPIRSGGKLTLTIVNTSDAYAGIEFSKTATVTEINGNNRRRANVTFTGDFFAPPSILLPPNRN